ncbi:hypothetical protein PFICI_13359 [Pestalotiopsis fici W106-1]|uniref:Uncharacterized protein n=1 Tax=Pestalotiopsis fici (strain W106-1 / CGMCC3.15140) TaxID=1229662 RepID=W3WLT0_PESFW|nr:uncharacterized protein PFICI_13359 [Pestalotiopsis fici W106-1]ETS74875.1 hypothetical protein PFICI_13359 [Pestalotiopsis fici W106-1]
MATSPLVLVPTFVGLSLLGAYAGPVTLGLNGFGDANWIYILTPADPAQVGLPGAPKPFTKDYTGVEAVDGILAALVVYFSALIDGDIEPRFKLYGYCAFWQLGALVVILVLEGLRGGNRGRIASW